MVASISVTTGIPCEVAFRGAAKHSTRSSRRLATIRTGLLNNGLKFKKMVLVVLGMLFSGLKLMPK